METDGSGLRIQEMTSELESAEGEMSQFMRLNLLFSQISTDQFGLFVRNADVEFTQLPQNPARDFFLRNVNFEPLLTSFANHAADPNMARVIREFH